MIPQTVAVLPADTMRRFAWSGAAPVLDPLPRWVRADVLTTGDLTISGVTVPVRETGRTRCSGCCWRAPTRMQLRRAGVGWLVVEAGTPGDMGSSARTFERLPVTYRGRDLMLYRVGGDTAGAPANRRLLAVIAHLAWLAMLIGGAIGMTISRRTDVRPFR